jgi:phage/plasmid-like protein (TIGR03299 family)
MATKNTARPIAPSGFQPNLRVNPGTNGGGDVAEYIQPRSSGLESGVYVATDRALPWHVTLARRLNQPELMAASATKMTVEEALTLAGMDWEVAMAPTFALIGDTYVEVPNRFVSYRQDTGAVLGNNLSGSFKLVQNRSAFTFGDYLLDEGGANIESAGSLSGGRAVFVSFELPDGIHVEGDPSDYRLYLLLSNGHDGNHRFRADVTVERALCRNTVRIGQARAIQSWSIRHTSGLDGRVQAAREGLKLTHAYVEDFTAGAAALVGKTLVDRQVDDILAKLFPVTEAQAAAIADGKEPVTVASKVLSVYRDSPSVEPVRGTAYGLFNAVTEYADHFRSYRDGAAGDALDNRAESLLFTDGDQDVKQRAWDLLRTVADDGGKAPRRAKATR